MEMKFRDKVLDTANREYVNTFWDAMHGRGNLLDNQEIGKDKSSGMHIMPIGSNQKFTNLLTAKSAFRDIATVFETYDSSYKLLAKDCDDHTEWVPENGDIPIVEGTDDFTATFSQVKKLASIVKLQSAFVYDMGFNVENYLIDRLSKAFARGEDNGFVNGDGENAAFGILHPEHGAETGAETDSLTFDDIHSLFFSVDPEYRSNATWMMNDETALYLRGLKDEAGNYLWRGSEDALLGRPVHISNFMPSAASGNRPVAFGDFSYYWIIVRRPLMVKILNEIFAMEGKIGYFATELLDGFLIRKSAIKTINIR